MTTRTDFALEMFANYPPQPFTYDADSKQFTVGSDQVALNEWIDYDHRRQPVDPITPAQAETLITDNALLLTVFGTHCQVPRMYNWLTSLDAPAWRTVSNNATEAMIDAFATVSDMPKKKLLTGTHWGFGVGLYRPGHPSFNVLGDCACYGVSPDAHLFGQDSWEEGFSEYTPHNIDFPAQKIALFAGAGALAAMVRE